MTNIHYFLLICVSTLLSSIIFYYLRNGGNSKSLFYFCIISISFFVSLPLFSKFYSYLFNEVLKLPDARISILTIICFGLSSISLYLLSKVSKQDKQLRIINRELALISFKIEKE